MATIEDVSPKRITGYKVIISSLNGNTVDITPLVVETSIFESIYSINLHGHLVIADNSALFSDLPIVGQEKINIQFIKNDIDVDLNFIVSGVEDLASYNDSVGAYVITFTSESKLVNAVSEFSKSFSGLGVNIIRQIYNDNFGKNSLDVKVKGGNSMNVVMPFTKPFAAINMIQRASYDTSKSPLFIFDTVFGDAPELTSLYAMQSQEIIHKIYNRINVNTEVDGRSSRDMLQHVGEAYNIEMPSAYNVFEQISDGTFASSIDTIDISTKSIMRAAYNYLDHGVVDSTDYMHSNFQINDNALTKYTSANISTNFINTKAFSRSAPGNISTNEGLGNIYGTDKYARATVDSKLNRIDTIEISMHMDSVPAVRAGKIVDIDFTRFTPMLSDKDNPKDEMTSGRYLVSSLRHHIKLGEYTMALNLVRNNVGVV